MFFLSWIGYHLTSNLILAKTKMTRGSLWECRICYNNGWVRVYRFLQERCYLLTKLSFTISYLLCKCITHSMFLLYCGVSVQIRKIYLNFAIWRCTFRQQLLWSYYANTLKNIFCLECGVHKVLFLLFFDKKYCYEALKS